ncbi:antibiotic biosynthesis regulator FhaB [Alteromonas gracilis]
MSDLTLMLIRFAYLAVLWLFVLSAVSVVRSDMFGARAARDEAQSKPRRKESRPSRPKRGEPTTVVILEGGNRGETLSLADAPLLIGRGTDAAIRLDDDYVSTRHARIDRAETQWYVEDLGSTNGTYVGSTRITQPTALAVGTQIRIGKTILELRK